LGAEKEEEEGEEDVETTRGFMDESSQLSRLDILVFFESVASSSSSEEHHNLWVGQNFLSTIGSFSCEDDNSVEEEELLRSLIVI